MFFLFWAILFFGSIVIGRLNCTACERNVRCGPERYCPACGAGGSVKNGGLWSFRTPRCELCDTALPSGKGGPRYKIKFCTHCGAHLSDAGV